MKGSTSDKTTLKDFLTKIERLYGKAGRTWIMDRGIPTEEVLGEMREAGTSYLVGTPRGRLTKLQREIAGQPWRKAREASR
jgi:transposase